MKALIQRVARASVTVVGVCVGEIGRGLLVFLGVEKADTNIKAKHLLDKVLGYRIFPDEGGRMNLSLKEVSGELLVVSQFTLVADTQKGLRPGFSKAGSPEGSECLYDLFLSLAKEGGVQVQSGVFGADMQVEILNDGPVTFLLEN
jgi:D-tyrosyl-tRNA(Tyr) deacylase